MMKDKAMGLSPSATSGKYYRAGYLARVFLPALLLAVVSLRAQVGVHTDFPDASSAMEIYATDKGLLIPRVVLTSDLTSPNPVSSPATGLLVFNNGANQAVGFYYWSGSQWVAIGGGGGGGTDFWSLTGNAGTNVNSNFLGTTDNQQFVIRSNNAERMRFDTDGQITVGLTASYYSNDLFTIKGNASQDYVLNLYSPYVGMYSKCTYASVYAEEGRYGLVALIDTINGFGVYSKNYHTSGHGMITVGANAPAFSLGNHIVGINSTGNDGVFAVANLGSGTGVIALGNSLDSASTLPGGSGGAFTGFSGVYAKGVSSNGIGVVGVGNNANSYTIPTNGCGGTFTGYHGAYAFGNASSGIGITALGSNAGSYQVFANGLGGTFAGYHGLMSLGNNTTAGTGVIGMGNNNPTYYTLGTGSGGAFTGTYCGVYGYATDASNGNKNGGYFATAGNANQNGYAYVAGRYNNATCKIIGTGTVNTIVKDREGDLIALTCPEAPEALFQDYGIGQLVDGRAHIEIDPDLAINIMVNEDHPLKVYVTLEGDCNGVYVTNKSASGFDVVELQGGTSSVPFAWQIVATRANEYATDSDGTTVLVSDYSRRFPPAPGPLEQIEHKDNRVDVKRVSAEMSAVQEVEDTRIDKNASR